MTPAAAVSDVRRMQCMEVWGGNQAVEQGVSVPGVDAWVYCSPYHGEVRGGDVYYLSSCASGRVTRLLLADVSGHGDRAGPLGEDLRYLMRRYVNHIDQRRFVRAMNRAFMRHTGASGSFATAVVLTLFTPTNDLALTNAGHPAPILWRATERAWSILQGGSRAKGLANLPLGIESGVAFDETGEGLSVNDVVVCYTDSLMEARDAAGTMLGVEGIRRMLEGLDPSRPERLIPELLERVRAFDAGALDADDVTVVVLRPNGQGGELPATERLKAPARLAGSALDRLRGRGPIALPDFSPAYLLGGVISVFNRAAGRAMRRRAEAGHGAEPPR